MEGKRLAHNVDMIFYIAFLGFFCRAAPILFRHSAIIPLFCSEPHRNSPDWAFSHLQASVANKVHDRKKVPTESSKQGAFSCSDICIDHEKKKISVSFYTCVSCHGQKYM